ncbi:MAG: hypothetical protein IPM82_26985 [Saprospiraceae bacterium]|nr:hypothetical protein [Saprospiraceae bacterium]
MHFVNNNQIGFDRLGGRPFLFDLLPTLPARCNRLFFVNGDDPEAVFCCKMAMEYRQLYNADVFIDMVCYRKHGHNEGDDQSSQPTL